jgi:hypothetical protein
MASKATTGAGWHKAQKADQLGLSYCLLLLMLYSCAAEHAVAITQIIHHAKIFRRLRHNRHTRAELPRAFTCRNVTPNREGLDISCLCRQSFEPR